MERAPSADRKTRAGEPPAEVNGRPHITFKENVRRPCDVIQGQCDHHALTCTVLSTSPKLANNPAFSRRIFRTIWRRASSTTMCGARGRCQKSSLHRWGPCDQHVQ